MADLVNQGSNFAEFVRFRPHSYAHTQQSLSPLWVATIAGLREAAALMYIAES